MKNPTIKSCSIIECVSDFEPNGKELKVVTTWNGVQITSGYNYVLGTRQRKMAERLRAAILAGKVFANPTICRRRGKTYVSFTTKVLGRTMNADLRRLGF